MSVPPPEPPPSVPAALPGPPPYGYFIPAAPPPPYVPAPRRPPEQPPAAVRWGIPDAVVVVLLVPASVLVGYGYLVLHLPVSQGPFTFVSSVLSYGLLVAALVYISRRRGLRSLRADFGLAFRPVDLAIGLGIAVLVRIVTAIESVVVVEIAGKGPSRGNVDFGHDPFWLVVNGFVVGALLAPLVEELVIRGLVLRAVRWAILRGPRRSPRVQPADPRIRTRAAALAIVASAVVFSALHLYEAIGDPVLLVTLALFTLTVGLAHGLITVATGRLGPAIIAHAILNASSLLFSLLLSRH